MTRWVLITGGIGSGKTTVADLFNEFNVAVIDTDAISRQLTQVNGLAIAHIRSSFGDEAIDENNALNRNWMRDKIFCELVAKEQLEKILHPMIFNEVVQLQQLVTDIYGLVVVPIFTRESIYHSIVDRVLVVDVDYETQIKRVQQRNSLSRNEVIKIINSQLSREARLKLADDVIVNHQDLGYLQQEVVRLHQYYLQKYT